MEDADIKDEYAYPTDKTNILFSKVLYDNIPDFFKSVNFKDEHETALFVTSEMKGEPTSSSYDMDRISRLATSFLMKEEISDTSNCSMQDHPIENIGRPTEDALVNFNSKLTEDCKPTTRVRNHKCIKCGVSFYRPGHLKRHIQSHDGIKPCKCSQCDKSFPDSSSLRKHMFTLTHKGGSRLYNCPQCGKCFAQAGYLRKHVIFVHSGLKPFKCKICGHEFSQGGHPRSHFIKHTGEKPFKCEICDKCFIRLRQLKKHTLAHANKKPKCKTPKSIKPEK